jgi:bifunctional UDP-N-acetylglucosamine pyrophosphorylase/glucosamine-1-phosphate N-acetyltransferase
MKAVLLAAGRSKRMQPVTDKNFLLFLGKPLIVHQIERILHAGFNDLIIVGGGHNLDLLKNIPEKYNLRGDFEFVEQKNLDEGMAGAVLSAETSIKSEPFCVISGNDVVDQKAYSLVKDNIDEDFENLIIGKKVESYFPGGYLKTDENNSIQAIIEKPGEGNEPGDLVNIVIHLHKNPKKLIEKLKKVSSDRDDRYEVALDELINEGAKMKAVEFEGYWQPVKYPWHVFKLMKYFFNNNKGGISKKAEIAKTATINNKDKVIIEDGVKIYDNAVINGPCYIGKGSVIANNSLVRDSMINEGCVIGYSTEIARSYLGKDVWTHTNYIGDSIVSDNCSFGSGTVTGNLRLDEGEIKMNVKDEKINTKTNKFGIVTGKNIRCGINTSFMPGIKIGSDSMIGAGIVVPKDIPEDSFVKAKTEVEIRKNKSRPKPGERKRMLDKLS